MNFNILIALCVLLASCSTAKSVEDKDTQGLSPTLPMGEGDLTIVENSESKQLTLPTYLPGWAPIFPSAKIESKTVQRYQKKIVGRGTGFVTNAPYDSVEKFYRAYYKKNGIKPTSETSGPGGTIFSFDNNGKYQSLLNIERVNVLNGSGYVKISVAQTSDS